MKTNLLNYLVLCIFLFVGHELSGQQIVSSVNSTFFDKLKDVSICQWRNNAKTCLSLSFDDNNLSHNEIARILEQHGFKGTFFVIAGSMYKDSIKEIIKHGHEIGSHTVTHPDLTTLDSSQIDYQLTYSKNLIEKAFGIKCVSFAEPGHLKTEQSTRIAFRNYLFIRNYSEYPAVQRERWAFSQITTNVITLPGLMKELHNAMNSGNMFVLNGHGLGNEGYVPTNKQLFIQVLDSIKKYTNKGEVWVTTLKEGGQYENLFRELSLNKRIVGDSLILNIINYNEYKYKNIDSSIVSIEIPKLFIENTHNITNNLYIQESKEKFIISVDLKKQKRIALRIKGIQLNSDYINSNETKDILYTYPNPVKDKLRIEFPGDILRYELFDINGNLMSNEIGNYNQADLSKLPNGIYILKVVTKKGLLIKKYNKYIIKI